MPLLVIGMTYFRTLRDDILPRNVKIEKVTERYMASGVHSVWHFFLLLSSIRLGWLFAVVACNLWIYGGVA